MNPQIGKSVEWSVGTFYWFTAPNPVETGLDLSIYTNQAKDGVRTYIGFDPMYHGYLGDRTYDDYILDGGNLYTMLAEQDPCVNPQLPNKYYTAGVGSPGAYSWDYAKNPQSTPTVAGLLNPYVLFLSERQRNPQLCTAATASGGPITHVGTFGPPGYLGFTWSTDNHKMWAQSGVTGFIVDETGRCC